MKRKELTHYIINQWDPNDPTNPLMMLMKDYEFVLTQANDNNMISIHKIIYKGSLSHIGLRTTSWLSSIKQFVTDPWDTNHRVNRFLEYYSKMETLTRFCLCNHEYLNIELRRMGIQSDWIIHKLSE